ncbi:MAG: extracellular solute-binding protein, partial [Eubacteriales bacterium]
KSTELILVNDTLWQEFAKESERRYDDLETWEGLLEVAKEYYEFTGGNAFFGMDSLENFIIIASKSLGLEIFDSENQQALLDEKILKQIFEYYVEGYALGYFKHSAQFRSDDIRSGAIVAYTGSSASVSYFPSWIEKNGEKMDIIMRALPYASFEGTIPYVLSQGAGIAMGKTGAEQEAAAAEFIKYFLEQDVEFAIKTSYIPAMQSFFDSTIEEQDELLTEYGVITSNGKEVYHLVMEQIQQDLTYQPDAFVGSYDIRIELSKAFQLAADASLIKSNELKDTGMELDDILVALDLEEQFANVMQTIRLSLESKNINYR